MERANKHKIYMVTLSSRGPLYVISRNYKKWSKSSISTTQGSGSVTD